jgi:membrane protease YdiL (CAAX protease family)
MPLQHAVPALNGEIAWFPSSGTRSPRSDLTGEAKSWQNGEMSLDDSEPTEQTPDEVFVTAVLFECGLAVLALFLGWALGPSARNLIPKLEADQLWSIGQGLMYGAAAAVPILVLVELIRRIPWGPIQKLEELTDDGMIKALLKLRPAELMVVSLCAGIGEELLFRGWLMYWVADLMAALSPDLPPTWVMGVALVASSLVFGVFHPVTKLYIVLASLMGLYFGALLIYTENLLVPIAAHALYDAAQLIITAYQERKEGR